MLQFALVSNMSNVYIQIHNVKEKNPRFSCNSEAVFISVPCPGSALSHQEVWPSGRHQTGQQIQQTLPQVSICLLLAGMDCWSFKLFTPYEIFYFKYMYSI